MSIMDRVQSLSIRGGLPKVISAIEKVTSFATLFGGLLILVMFGITTYDVFMRYFVARPTRWGLEMGEMLMIPLTYLSLGYLLQRGEHVRVDLVINRIHGRVLSVINVITFLLGLLFASLMLWRGSLVFLDFAQRGKLSQIGLLPLAPASLFIPLGAVLLVVQFFICIVKEIAMLKRGRNS